MHGCTPWKPPLLFVVGSHGSLGTRERATRQPPRTTPRVRRARRPRPSAVLTSLARVRGAPEHASPRSGTRPRWRHAAAAPDWAVGEGGRRAPGRRRTHYRWASPARRAAAQTWGAPGALPAEEQRGPCVQTSPRAPLSHPTMVRWWEWRPCMCAPRWVGAVSPPLAREQKARAALRCSQERPTSGAPHRISVAALR